jgi:hypothetical protein
MTYCPRRLSAGLEEISGNDPLLLTDYSICQMRKWSSAASLQPFPTYHFFPCGDHGIISSTGCTVSSRYISNSRADGVDWRQLGPSMLLQPCDVPWLLSIRVRTPYSGLSSIQAVNRIGWCLRDAKAYYCVSLHSRARLRCRPLVLNSPSCTTNGVMTGFDAVAIRSVEPQQD